MTRLVDAVDDVSVKDTDFELLEASWLVDTVEDDSDRDAGFELLVAGREMLVEGSLEVDELMEPVDDVETTRELLLETRELLGEVVDTTDELERNEEVEIGKMLDVELVTGEPTW